MGGDGVAPAVGGGTGVAAEGADAAWWPGKAEEGVLALVDAAAATAGWADEGWGGWADGGGPRRWRTTLAPSDIPHSPRVLCSDRSLPRYKSLQVWGCQLLSLTIVRRVSFSTNTVSLNSASRCREDPVCKRIVKEMGIAFIFF